MESNKLETGAKHTPGPWKLSHQLGDGFSVAFEIAPKCGKLVCVATAHNTGGQAFFGFPLNDEIAKSNARLIAAAPELLTVAQKVRDLEGTLGKGLLELSANDLMAVYDAARSAIAKATGQTP